MAIFFKSSKKTIAAIAHPEAGLSLFGVIGSLLVMALMTPILYELWAMGSTEIRKRHAADHLSMVNKAAANYVRKHGHNLINNATPSTGPALTVQDLIVEDLLPVGFSSRNVWLQEYRIYIRKPHNNDLQAITLTTGGKGQESDAKFANAVIPSTATYLGGAGGFIPTGLIQGTKTGTLHGSFSGWVLDLASLGIPSPGAGHLGALATFDGSDLDQDFLYRYEVPGHPELNEMQTELDMTGHAIQNVHEVQFTDRELTTETCDTTTEGRVFLDKNQGLYMCRNGNMEVIADTGNSAMLKEATLAKDGDTIQKPVCPPGTNTVPQIHVAPAITSAGYESPPMTALQAWATSLSDTEWRVHLRLLTADKDLGWVHPTVSYGRILVFSGCFKDTVATP